MSGNARQRRRARRLSKKIARALFGIDTIDCRSEYITVSIPAIDYDDAALLYPMLDEDVTPEVLESLLSTSPGVRDYTSYGLQRGPFGTFSMTVFGRVVV